jgi:hypothetical protein
MRRLVLATADTTPAPVPGLLTEEQVRDQLSAAEELLFVGHGEPALLAAGAALVGTLRLRAALRGAESGAPAIDLLQAERTIGPDERRLLERALEAGERLASGFAPIHAGDTTQARIERITAAICRLLEPEPEQEPQKSSAPAQPS